MMMLTGKCEEMPQNICRWKKWYFISENRLKSDGMSETNPPPPLKVNKKVYKWKTTNAGLNVVLNKTARHYWSQYDASSNHRECLHK